jgi:hypothetical protein
MIRRWPIVAVVLIQGFLINLCLMLSWSAGAQDAAPADRNAINTRAHPGNMMADSPVTFPKEGALPAKYPPDVRAQNEPAEKDYYIFSSPCRSLAQIAEIQTAMPKGEFTPPQPDWPPLQRTRRLLTEGGELRLLALGDSIVNDTMRSGWVAKLAEAYPKARLQTTVYVRGGGGCQHYKELNRIATNVIPRRPNLVFIGGISQRDTESIREVIHQLRTGLPEVEVLLATGAFGTVDPREPEALAKAPHSGTGAYGQALKNLAAEEGCACLDMTTPWAEYVRSAQVHPHLFYRDAVHANEFGEQILSKILMAFWTASAFPELNWEPRSDWINVRTGPAPQAVGDGAADDTAALQAALDQLSANPGEPNTIYLPPGTYRITRTLVVKQKDGIAIIGHGRPTRVVWDGPGGKGDDARMFWSNGAPRSRYVGIAWDGRGRAHVGFDHDSKGYFETEIDHQHEAFLNFTGSGIRIGHDQTTPGAQATAETTYVNCLFSNCESGLSLMQFNDYNHTVAGCEFRDCGGGINASAGPNFYVRDSHFDRSKTVDVRVRGEHSLSIRRCTSVGSRLFIDEETIAPLTIQDCQVSGWANPSGAIRLRAGPVVLFDCVFTRPPTRHPPIILSAGQHLVLSSNRSAGTEGLVKPGDSQNIAEIPSGEFGASLTSPEQRFLKSTVRIPGKVFDAQRDFGAKGDGKTDDTAAVQSAIDAARTHGQGAMAYLPSGDYAIAKTLEVSGRDYCFGGGGTHSRLLWRGAAGGVLVRVNDPERLTMENLDVGNAGDQKNTTDILQTGSGLPASMHYERVWVFGMYRKQAGVQGLRARDLPVGTVIVADHLNGNVSLTDCARASLLFNSSYEGAIVVQGRKPQRDGLLGFLTRLATINTNGLYLKDSQSIVMSDYYVESADRMMEFHGNADDPAGRVTIQMAKSHCSQNPVIQLDNYRGRVTLGPSMFYPGGIKPALITRHGPNRCDFTLMACQAYEVTPKFDFSGPGTITLLENTGAGMGENQLPEGALGQVASALDDLRKLGALDLTLNYVGGKAPGRSN